MKQCLRCKSSKFNQRGTKVKFCSRECYLEYKYEHGWKRWEAKKCEVCSKFLNKNGSKRFCSIQCWHITEAKERRGKLNLKKGKRIHKGYIQILNPDRKGMKSKRYLPEHRYIMEQKLGIKLNSNEVVHHINGDTTDNTVKNLMVLKRKEHSRNHRLNDTEITKQKRRDSGWKG